MKLVKAILVPIYQKVGTKLNIIFWEIGATVVLQLKCSNVEIFPMIWRKSTHNWDSSQIIDTIRTPLKANNFENTIQSTTNLLTQ